MKKKEWKPWDDFVKEPETLKISQPPCKSCVHWKPQRKYAEHAGTQRYAGIICCHAKEMERDFSCYESRDSQNK